MSELSRKAIDRLGDRLVRDSVSNEDLQQLSALQRRASSSLERVVATLGNVLGRPPTFAGTRVDLTHRVKTPNTLLDKVRRGLRLSSIQDIAGVRLVHARHEDQDHLADLLVATFPDAKVVDRRLHPSHGYRAVHIIVRVEGSQIEIQVRTLLQHMWANATERLADEWGRGIRYGEPPLGESAEVVAQRTAWLAAWNEVAERLWEFERESGAAVRLSDISAMRRAMHAMFAFIDAFQRCGPDVQDIARQANQHARLLL